MDGTLRAEPTDCEVQPNSALDFDAVTATFAKTQLRDETLRVQILADGEVVDERQTSAEFGTVSVNRSLQDGTTEQGL